MDKIYEKITARPVWAKSAGQIWDERFESLTSGAAAESAPSAPATPHRRTALLRRTAWYAAAAAALLLIVSAVAVLYTREVATRPGAACLTAQLPDGSQVILSSGTRVSWRPLLWRLSPKVSLEGEALFSGHHASGFEVKAAMGTISVLGTTFDATAFDSTLAVACLEGSVRVSAARETVVLTQCQQTVMKDGKLQVEPVGDQESVSGWIHGVFSFDNRPLDEVIRVVQRFYNVRIAAPADIDTLRYTGRFTKDLSAREVVDIVGSTFGLKFRILRP